LPEVLEIERQSFFDPWDEEQFILRLRVRNCIGMVAESNQVIAGFMVYEFTATRIILTNIAVLPDSRRQGIGSMMLDKLYKKLGSRRKRISLHVRDGNLPGHLFFKANGYEWTATHPNYFDNGDDAYRMVRRLCETGVGSE